MERRGKIKGNQINWNQVFYFCRIAAQGSIKDAATELEVSSPTLSEHLAQLEKDLEVELFYRQHRKLVLTPQGSRLFQYAKQMFEAGQRLIDVVSPVALGCYPLSVAVVPGPSMSLAYRVLSAYQETFGLVTMRVAQESHVSLERALQDAKYDFAFADRGTTRTDLVLHPVASSLIGFYVSERWREKPLDVLLQDLPLLQLGSDATTRSYTEHLLSELEISPRAVITSDYPSQLQDLCLAGQGVGVFSEAAVRAFRLKLVPVKLPKTALEIQDKLYAIWTKDAENSEAVKRLKEVLSGQQLGRSLLSAEGE